MYRQLRLVRKNPSMKDLRNVHRAALEAVRALHRALDYVNVARRAVEVAESEPEPVALGGCCAASLRFGKSKTLQQVAESGGNRTI